MTGPLIHCPKNNLNHPVKTEPVTVGADTLFLFFLTYIYHRGLVFLFIYLYSIQYSQLNLPTLDPNWGGIGRRFKTVTLTTGPPHLLCKGSRYCTVQLICLVSVPKSQSCTVASPPAVTCSNCMQRFRLLLAQCLLYVGHTPPPPQRMILVFIQ